MNNLQILISHLRQNTYLAIKNLLKKLSTPKPELARIPIKRNSSQKSLPAYLANLKNK